ncbi:MAG: tRNA (adenosine(37)-N6)-threonylcarbamoyltransferase complex dimerization subunit type 1 TsaB [Bdellovibrionales bacterium]|nr:tRNA (adenosine(37)-N6)-threonylcarbamoyltransferase complex dimerization subunit type 1 TsaB [Bdellovibrionales bacterium]
MLSLAINTSSTKGSLALFENKKLLRGTEWEKDQEKNLSHSELATPALEAFFFNHHSLNDLDLLICGKGPGSFTGIRVGLSVIKSLAYIRNLPIIAPDDCFNIAINSLDHDNSLPIAVIIDAQKNSVFCATYEWKQNRLVLTQEPTLVSLSDLEKHLTAPQYLCLGDGYLHYAPYFSEETKSKLSRNQEIADHPSAKNMSEYLLNNLDQFPTQTWKDLLPLYLRASAAEEVLIAKQAAPKPK